MPSRPTSTYRVLAVAATLIAAPAIPLAPSAHAEFTAPLGERCPHLYVLGVQSDEEGFAQVGVDSDTGAVGQVLGPVTAATNGSVQRAYVPYGHSADGAELDYRAAAATAAEQLDGAATEVVTRCPHTRIAVVGYAQGASAVSAFAHRVGHGAAGVPADQVAAIALLANPDRPPGTPVLPGRPGASTPDAPPGTTGEHVASVELLDPPLTGAGIGAPAAVSDYGALSGRVADLCVPGDATCDVPTGSPLATTAANIAARTDTRDPVAAISTIAQALAATVYTTAVEVVNEDLTGARLDELSYQPARTLAQRLAAASAPEAVPPGPEQALAAMLKIGTIGLDAAITVARTVFTPATVAELAAAGLANPWAAVAALGAELTSAIVELIPPQTALRWVDEAFEAITTTVTDHGQLYTLAATAQHSDTAGRHASYSSAPATGSGRSMFAATSDWFIAAARDIAATGNPSVTPAAATTTAQPAPTALAPASAPTGAVRPGSGG